MEERVAEQVDEEVRKLRKENAVDAIQLLKNGEVVLTYKPATQIEQDYVMVTGKFVEKVQKDGLKASVMCVSTNIGPCNSMTGYGGEVVKASTAILLQLADSLVESDLPELGADVLKLAWRLIETFND